MSNVKEIKDLAEEIKKTLIQNKKRKTQRQLLWIELIVYTVGYGVMWYNSNFWVVFGLFGVLLANNLHNLRIINGKENNSSKELWKED